MRASGPPVVLTVNGRSIRGRVAPMGGCNLIGITKANRALLGLEAGTTYAIEVTLDTAERTVEVPADLTAAFADQPELRAAWDAWSFTRRREAAASITEAKRSANVSQVERENSMIFRGIVNHVFEVVHGSELRVDGRIVGACILAAQSSFFIFLPVARI